MFNFCERDFRSVLLSSGHRKGCGVFLLSWCRASAALVLFVLGAITFVGCGGNGFATGSVEAPAQIYHLVVTATDATSGAKTTTNLTLTVQ